MEAIVYIYTSPVKEKLPTRGNILGHTLSVYLLLHLLLTEN